MTTIVIMPGGFHPYHAGHHALYQSAQRTFPDAEVYVAATNDTSSRPFPFAVKEKLARLAGVETGHFVQVSSPFRAAEITSKYNPEKDVLIFVRSEKDANSQPQPGGVKKDGSPSYLQPLLGARKLEPFAKHAYMAYLPTVEFGPGMTSATQIRSAWPSLDERRKTALVMSLYPKTQSNTKLAATVVKLLDTAIGSEHGVAEGAPIVVAQAPIDIRNPKKAPQPYRNQGDIVPPTTPPSTEKRGVKGRPGQRPMPQHNENNDYLDE
jgi:glycerol-3-phosphate cytidylyltransferase-like family protein